MMEMADMANLRALDVFMPMHLLLGEGGVIKRVGPTMKKLRPEGQLLGRTLDEVFTIGDNGRGTRDGSVPVGTKLYLTFREGAQTPLKGIAMPVGENGRGTGSAKLAVSSEALRSLAFDADGTSLIVRAGGENDSTGLQRSSSERIACGRLSPIS